MEIRALWSDMKFYVFYMNSSMKNFEKNESLLKYFKIEFNLMKNKKFMKSDFYKNNRIIAEG